MSTSATHPKRRSRKTRVVGLLLAFLTALTSLGVLTTTNSSPAAADQWNYIPNWEWDSSRFDYSTIDWAAILNEAPTHTGYLACTPDWVYADFADADAPDSELTVEMKIDRINRNGYRLTYTTTMNMSDGHHGVFFHKDMGNFHGIPFDEIDSFTMQAIDRYDARSEIITVDYNPGEWNPCTRR